MNDGVYSKPQAERGAKGYRDHCLRCHTTDAFTGSYMAAWYGQTANGLFELIHASMPQDNPGGLSREEVVDLLTFVFKENGWPAGATDLASTREALEQVVIEAPVKRQP